MKRIDDDSPERLLEQMGRLVVPVMLPEQEVALQKRSAASVDRMLESVADKRQLQRGRISGAILGVAAVAAAVAVALGGSWLSARKSLPVHDGAHLSAVSGGVELFKGAELTSRAVKPGLALAAGDVLTTAAGAHASLTLADQAAVELAPTTRLRVATTEGASDQAKDERLELSEGLLSFRVPKLEAGHTLSVRTPDSLVTVRGTRFSVGVERRGPDAIVTRVAVSEGRVQVDSHGRTLFLTRGERWSSVIDAPPSVPTASVSQAQPTLVAEPSVEKRSVPTPVRESAAVRPTAGSARVVESARAGGVDLPRERAATSTLAEENRMYEGALAAGVSARALAELETLMREYPRSPLIQSARVEHFRVLLKMGNTTAAAREARRYLSDYPAGFAREEARQIALRGLGDAD